MCLGVPAKIHRIVCAEKGVAEAQTGGVYREVNLDLLGLQGKQIDQLVGCWVLLHVGFALTIIDDNEAQSRLAVLNEIQLGEDFG